jgi:hypothetical protein
MQVSTSQQLLFEQQCFSREAACYLRDRGPLLAIKYQCVPSNDRMILPS